VSKIAHKEGEILFGLFGSRDWEKVRAVARLKRVNVPILGIKNSASPVVARDDRSTVHKNCRAVRSGHINAHVNAFVWNFWRAEIVEENFSANFS